MHTIIEGLSVFKAFKFEEFKEELKDSIGLAQKLKGVVVWGGVLIAGTTIKLLMFSGRVKRKKA